MVSCLYCECIVSVLDMIGSAILTLAYVLVFTKKAYPNLSSPFFILIANRTPDVFTITQGVLFDSIVSIEAYESPLIELLTRLICLILSLSQAPPDRQNPGRNAA